MKLLARLALVLLATLLLTELGVRAYRTLLDQGPPHPDPAVEEEWEWARRHLRSGRPRVVGHIRHDPQLGWIAPRKVRPAAGRETVRRERTPGVPRLVLTGDSFTRELGTLGEAFRPRWEVVNLAVQGFGAGQAWLRFRTAGVPLEADVAVYGIYLRDYFRTFSRFRNYAKPTFSLEPAGELVVGNVPVPSPEALYEAYRSGERAIGRPGRSWLWDSVRERWNVRRVLRAEELDVFAGLLRAFRDDALGSGACPLLLVFPTRPDDYYGEVDETLDGRLTELARTLDLPRLSLAEALYAPATPAERAALFESGRGAHMSPHGRAEVIRVLDEALDAFEPGACRSAPAAPAHAGG